MVNKEQLKLTDGETVTLPIQKIERKGDGSWTMVLDVDKQIFVDGTRHIRFLGELRIKGRQFGRKARSDSTIKVSDES